MARRTAVLRLRSVESASVSEASLVLPYREIGARVEKSIPIPPDVAPHGSGTLSSTTNARFSTLSGRPASASIE